MQRIACDKAVRESKDDKEKCRQVFVCVCVLLQYFCEDQFEFYAGKVRTFCAVLTSSKGCLKVQSTILTQNTSCQIQRISPHGPLAFHSVCALKKQSGVHTQPWLCKQETNRVARVKPPTQVDVLAVFPLNT